MIKVYSKRRIWQNGCHSMNQYIEPKHKLKNQLTVDEFGQIKVEKLRVVKR